MTTLHLSEVDGMAVVPREEFEKLLELARRSEAVTVEVHQEDAPSTRDMARLAERTDAWQWLHDEPDLYTREDIQP